MKKIIIAIIFIIEMYPCIIYANTYSDVDVSHWAYTAITQMTEKGIVNGYNRGLFKPDKAITRAEFSKILVTTLNLVGKSSESINFKDVKKLHWARNYINVAKEYVPWYKEGDDCLYMPDSNSLREDVAMAIVKAMGLDNYNFNDETLNKFSDKDMISKEFKKYITIANENDLMNGNADGTFNPKGSLTRAEVCQLMLNILNNYEKIMINTNKQQDETQVSIVADKKSWTTLKEMDVIKIGAKNYDSNNGTLDYRIYYSDSLLLPGTFKEDNSISVKEIIEYAKSRSIYLYDREIIIVFLFDNLVEDKIEGKVTYYYKIEPENMNVEITSDKANRTSLKDTDTIKISAKNCDSNTGSLDYRVYYDDSLLLPGTFKEDNSISVKEIIEYAKSKNIDLYGKDIMITFLFDSYMVDREVGKVTYKYKIEDRASFVEYF